MKSKVIQSAIDRMATWYRTFIEFFKNKRSLKKEKMHVTKEVHHPVSKTESHQRSVRR